MNKIMRIGMDTSKYIFQLHGVDGSEQVVLRKRLSRKAMLEFFARLTPTVVVIEACGAAHHVARELGKLGHTAKLIAPQLVKPYVPRNKNDGRDAEGLCEAASRPRMRYVPVKTAEQQASLMLLGIRDQLVGRRTQLSNTIRGHAAEFGLIEAKGLDKLGSFLAAIEQDESVPVLARELFAACLRIRPGAGRTEGDRGQASGLAPRQCLEPAPGADPGCWSSHGRSAGDEGARSTGLPLRPAVCSLARPNTKGPFHRRKDQARQDHPRRR